MQRARGTGTRALIGLAALLFLLISAIDGVPAFAASTATSSAPAATAPLSPQEAQQLLNVLNDPKQRDAFTHTLSLMARGVSSPSSATGAAASAGTGVITPEAVELHHGLSTVGSQLRGYGRNFLGLFSDLRSVGVWFHNEISNPATRKILIDAFGRAAIILAVALALERALVMFLAPRVRAVTARAERREERLSHTIPTTPPLGALAPEGTAPDASEVKVSEADAQHQREALRLIARVPYALAHLALKLLPVGLFAAIGYLGATVGTNTSEAETVTETIVEAYIVARVLFLIVEMSFAPHSPAIRLIPASDSTAKTVTRWWNVLVAAPSIVACLSILGGEFDLSSRGTEAMIRAIVLIEHLMIAVFIWRMRPTVAAALEPHARKATGPFWAFLFTLAKAWWIPALFLDMALWLVWAAHLQGGYLWILRTLGFTILVCVVSRLVAVLAYSLQDRLFQLSPDVVQKRPGLRERLAHYYPYARGTLTCVITFISLVALTEAWGLDSVHFFMSTTLGSRLMSTIITMLVAVMIATAIWEVINDLLNRQLERYTESAQSTRATRLKTVMPIIRTVLLTVIIIVVLVTSLSQIGINVTPLLTGAGILGAAIAFGSQSLVKDFITGFFMLVEDAIQVGDWVTTGGVSGTVEHLSIRTVRVRAVNGDLHIIPFSSVSTIANTGRDYNQVIVNQKVDLAEDIAHIVGVMTDVVAEMQKEDEYKTILYSGYNDLGVNLSNGDGSIVIGTIRTAPMMKWKIEREFYRRLGKRMLEAGVKFPVPLAYTANPPGASLKIAANISTPPAGPDDAPGGAASGGSGLGPGSSPTPTTSAS